jgi:hypothetical protein
MLQDIIQQHQQKQQENENRVESNFSLVGEYTKMNKKQIIYCDDKFDGGSIPIGQREVLASDILKHELGIVCRPVMESLIDTAWQLVLHYKN